MKFIIICVLLVLILANQSHCQTIYTNQYGQPVGSSVTVGGTTYYSNQYGQPIGTQQAPPQPVAPPPPTPTVTPALPPLPLLPLMPLLK